MFGFEYSLYRCSLSSVHVFPFLVSGSSSQTSTAQPNRAHIIYFYYNIKCVGDKKIPYMTGDKNCFTWKETKITVSGTKRRHYIGSSSQFPEESLTHRGVLCSPFFSALQVEGFQWEINVVVTVERAV